MVRADVSKEADCHRLAQAALEKWGHIDGLINNAGITKFAYDHSDLSALQAQDFQDIYAVNVIGAYQMVRAVAPAMQNQGNGAIVNISSIAGVMGVGSSIAYAASKGAPKTMTMSLARALGPAIRVNAVCPGFGETRWLQEGLGKQDYDTAKTRYQKTTPLQKIIYPHDIANAAVWLLEGGQGVTGEFILVDSGAHLGGSPLKAR